MDLLARFGQFSAERNILFNPAPTLLALSGGVDSMVMMHLFQSTGMAFGIAHCNFQLRGDASDEDEAFLEKTAIAHGRPFFVKRFETKAYAESNGISTQMAARSLRYAWFAEIATQHDFPCVATAHNLNDSVETALLNFIRGTGLAGLTGIHDGYLDQVMGDKGLTQGERTTDSRRILLSRPLLFASKAEILEFARSSNILWREDSSNASDDYARNFLRHHIVPKMAELNPNFLRTAERNLARAQETKDNLDYLSKQFLGIDTFAHAENQQGYSIDKQKLMQLPSPRRALREMLKPQGFTEEQARQLAENLDHAGFELQSETGWHLLCDRKGIVVRYLSSEGQLSSEKQDDLLIGQDDLMIRLPDKTALFFTKTTPSELLPDGKEAVVVDAEKIQFPLFLRHWKEGDSFQPFGMGGQHMKLQDFFTNQKISRIEKDAVWLLFNGDGVLIWVIGFRLDERFRINKSTESALKIRACLGFF